jgi:hypothetical protein
VLCATGWAEAIFAELVSSAIKNPPVPDLPTPPRAFTVLDLAVLSMRIARLWLRQIAFWAKSAAIS